MQAKPCVHVKKEHLASQFRGGWSHQFAIFPFIDQGHLIILLHHLTLEKAHGLFNLLFLSTEEILRYEVPESCRKHEPFFKFWTGFSKLCTLLEKREQKLKQEHLFKFTNILWKYQLFYNNINIIWLCEHLLKMGTLCENS